jgi:hypothetical protein
LPQPHQNARQCLLLATHFNKSLEQKMAEYFNSADEVISTKNNHNLNPSNPQQPCATAGTFALRRALYFQRNLLNFQSDGTEGPSLYKTTANIHELFP